LQLEPLQLSNAGPLQKITNHYIAPSMTGASAKHEGQGCCDTCNLDNQQTYLRYLVLAWELLACARAAALVFVLLLSLYKPVWTSDVAQLRFARPYVRVTLLPRTTHMQSAHSYPCATPSTKVYPHFPCEIVARPMHVVPSAHTSL
jgi:hypothetical protein